MTKKRTDDITKVYDALRKDCQRLFEIGHAQDGDAKETTPTLKAGMILVTSEDGCMGTMLGDGRGEQTVAEVIQENCKALVSVMQNDHEMLTCISAALGFIKYNDPTTYNTIMAAIDSTHEQLNQLIAVMPEVLPGTKTAEA